MPIPLVVAGIAAGVIGAGGHLSAKETNERAQRRSEAAQELYNSAKKSLEHAQNRTEQTLLKLGYEKKNILDSSMHQFLSAYDKIKHVQVTESVGINEISKFTIDQQGALELREMINIYSSSVQSGATGAAAGAIVALAASGSLSFVTSGLAAAGSVLMLGEVGATAGIAGSALSVGAAMTPLAAVAAPVILFTGISASLKADENLEKANTMYAEAEAASEKMKISETLCGAISDRSEMFDDLLIDLNKMFSECTGLLAGVVRKKEGRLLKKKLTSEDFSEKELKLIAVTRALAGAVKAVIDTPILSKDGDISYESENTYNQTKERLPDFSQAVEEVKTIDFNVKPIKAKTVRNLNSAPNSAAAGMSVLGGARSIAAFIIGFVLANTFAEGLALSISNFYDKFLFLNAVTANELAVWLLLCTSTIVLVGRFKGTKVEKLCGFGAGISLFILYVQYCRTVELMDHYIIFSIFTFIVCSILWNFFENRKKTWQFAAFFSMEFMCMLIWSVMFLIYAFFSYFIGFSMGFCLVSTAILMFFISVFGMSGMLEES